MWAWLYGHLVCGECTGMGEIALCILEDNGFWVALCRWFTSELVNQGMVIKIYTATEDV